MRGPARKQHALKNRQRVPEHDVTREVFAAVVEQARAVGLMRREHFAVDGSHIGESAPLKSHRPKDEKRKEQGPPDAPGNPTVNFAARSVATRPTP